MQEREHGAAAVPYTRSPPASSCWHGARTLFAIGYVHETAAPAERNAQDRYLFNHKRTKMIAFKYLASWTVLSVTTLAPAVVAQQQPIKIGAISPYSGPFALHGVEVSRGFELAVDRVNAGCSVARSSWCAATLPAPSRRLRRSINWQSPRQRRATESSRRGGQNGQAVRILFKRLRREVR